MIPKKKPILTKDSIYEISRKIFQEELKNILDEIKKYIANSQLEAGSHQPQDKPNDIQLEEPMDINLVHYPANYNTTAECRINNFIIDKAVLDGRSQCTLMYIKTAH